MKGKKLLIKCMNNHLEVFNGEQVITLKKDGMGMNNEVISTKKTNCFEIQKNSVKLSNTKILNNDRNSFLKYKKIIEKFELVYGSLLKRENLLDNDINQDTFFSILTKKKYLISGKTLSEVYIKYFVNLLDNWNFVDVITNNDELENVKQNIGNHFFQYENKGNYQNVLGEYMTNQNYYFYNIKLSSEINVIGVEKNENDRL